MRSCIALLLGAGLVLTMVQPAMARKPYSDQAVGEAIRKGVEYLKSERRNGRWEKHGKGPDDKNYHPWGPTALATVALLSCGENPQQKDMKETLDLLAKAAEDETGTYTLGLMGNAFMLANRDTQGAYRKPLRIVWKRLVDSTKDGSFGYRSEGKHDSSGDNSNSQYGVLGVWAAVLDGKEEVPRKFWQVVMNHWLSDQNADGGWGYKSKDGRHQATRRTMAAAGVATLFVCFDNLFQNLFIDCSGTREMRAVQKGLDWFDKNFSEEHDSDAIEMSGRNGYYLYGIERVGLASGYKYFGQSDWYKLGAEYLLDKQDRDGSWKGVVETSFALLFLARGRQPVLINRLSYGEDRDRDGKPDDMDWNNRPRAAAYFTRWLSKKFETDVAWQIINMKVPVSEWHDAPILLITGSKDPEFDDDAIAKLRRYVLEGGTIVSVTECEGQGFREGIRKAYRKMFPKYELTPLGPDHLIYQRELQYDLGGKPKFHMIHNTVRPMVIHTDVDITKSWQLQDADTTAYRGFVNLTWLVTDQLRLRHRGVTHWPVVKDYQPVGTIKVARVKHDGVDDPEPLAGERLSGLMANRLAVKVEVTEPLMAGELADSGAKIAWMTGTGKLKLTDKQVQGLRAFIKAGGTLIVDAAGGDKDFAGSAELALMEAFEGRFSYLPATSEFYKGPKGTQDEKILFRARMRARVNKPRLKEMRLGGRPVVLLSRDDITAGLTGYECYGVSGYNPGDGVDPGGAYRLMRNLLLKLSPEVAAKVSLGDEHDDGKKR